MYRNILPLIIFGSFIVTYADSATQTDWFGGPGVLGPVIDWGDQFYLATNVDWDNIPGDILLQFNVEYTIDGKFWRAYSVYSEDIDGDGDMDVLGAGGDSSDDITWWENINSSVITWTKHPIADDFLDARSVYSEDIDGDGDMDVLGAAKDVYDIIWWENIDGLGTSWTKHTVGSDFIGAKSVYSEDIDGDGDMDVLGAAYTGDDITWWENINGSGSIWTEHIIDGNFNGAISVYSEDIDGDGDMDVLGAANKADEITWWENIDGSGTSWTEYTVYGDFDEATCVYSEDIDGDGDMDILGAAYYDDDITWWENIDGSGTSWTRHPIDGGFNGANSVYSEDMDGDGDMDVLGAAYNGGNITWWENINGSGTIWTKHTIDGDFDGALCAFSEDINGDGNMDILGSAYYDGISWWDLTKYSPEGSLESSILNTQGDPDWDYLAWNSHTPPGTSISFKVRASDDHTSMGVWSDTLISPYVLQGILNDGDRYVQYMAILRTSNPDSTPTLNDVTIHWDPLGVGDDPQVTEYLLFGAEPNPSCGSVSIGFAIPELSQVELSVYDITGRLVITPSQREYSPGVHQMQLGELTPGIYFCRMISEDFSATQRFVVIE